MLPMKMILFCAVASLVISSCTLAAPATKSTFTLTRDGQPAASIILGHNPTRAAEFAAAELQTHVREISGATLPIVRESADGTSGVTGARILVGDSIIARKLGYEGKNFKSQEYVVRVDPQTLILLGKDTRDYDTPDSTLWSFVQWPTKTEGKFGDAGHFNGKSTFVQIPYNNNFTDQAGTFEGWVRLDGEDREKYGTIFRLDGGNPWSYQIVQQEPHAQVISYTAYVDGQGTGIIKSKPLSPGWHFVMATYDANVGKMALYIDGELVDTSTYYKTHCQGAYLNIGGLITTPREILNPFKGDLEDLRISNVARAPYVPTAPLQKDDKTAILVNLRNGEWDNDSATMGMPIPDIFSDRGTLDATYDFLRRYCGVRWYMPGTIGTVVPEHKTLSITGDEIRRKPAMDYRYLSNSHFYPHKGDQEIPERDAAIWKLRINMGGVQYAASHSFQGYYGRFMKEHPDWFASDNPNAWPQLCYGNPELVAQVVKDARDFFDGKGLTAATRGAGNPGGVAAGKYFSLVPMDSNLWCAADKARFDQRYANSNQFSTGIASPAVWEFTNEVARQLAKTNPGAYVAQLAYWQYAYYPENLKLEPNIAVQMCLHTRNWWVPSMEANDRKILQEWTSKEAGKRPLYLWLYYCFPALLGRNLSYNVFPGFFAHQAVKQMQLYRESGIDGFSLEDSSIIGLSYLHDQVEFLVTFELANDPTQDGNALIREFFTKYYGAAGPAMEQLYNEIEATYTNPKNYPEWVQTGGQQHQNEELAWGYLGTPERVAGWQKLMDQAEAAAASPRVKERVELFRKSIWEPMKEGARRYQVVAPTQKKLRAAGPPSAQVMLVADASGDPAKVNWSHITPAQPWHTTMGGPSEREISLQLAHDQKYFYVRLEEPDSSNKLVNSGDVYSGDHWEMFFANDRKPPYHQFSLNMRGDTDALVLQEVGQSQKWNSGAKVLSQTDQNGVVSLIALPLNTITPQGIEPGSSFYANFFRARANGGALSWSATFSNSFHDLPHLGKLTLQN